MNKAESSGYMNIIVLLTTAQEKCPNELVLGKNCQNYMTLRMYKLCCDILNSTVIWWEAGSRTIMSYFLF